MCHLVAFTTQALERAFTSVPARTTTYSTGMGALEAIIAWTLACHPYRSRQALHQHNDHDVDHEHGVDDH